MAENYWAKRLMVLHAIVAAAICICRHRTGLDAREVAVCDGCVAASQKYMMALKEDVMIITGATEEEVGDWAAEMFRVPPVLQ